MKRLLFLAVLILLCGNIIFSETPVFQKSILALYKSSENQTKKDNEIVYFVEPHLKKMGFKVSYWDMDKGIPGPNMTKYSRAVISWFRGPSMKRADLYLDFLDRMFSENKKVIIIDNFGAYQDRDTKQYIQPLRLNSTLTNLGIMYQGDWTENKDVIKLHKINRSMVEHEIKQDITKSSFFYKFLSSDRDLSVHLSLKRTDKDYKSSPVIVTNKNGGFALTRYIYRVENKKNKFLLNIEKFLEETLFPKPKYQKIALIADPSEKEIASALKYAQILLAKVKIPYVTILPKDFRNMMTNDLRPYSSVGLFLPSDSGFNTKIIDKYMEDGGGIVSFIAGKFEKLKPYLGIKENKKRVGSTLGFNFDTELVLGDGVVVENKRYEWQPGLGTPVDSAKIFGTDYRKRAPIVWTGSYKKGKYLTWNWNDFSTGEFMGLLLESFFYVQDLGVAAVPALALMFIDDWPIPMYNVVKKPLDIPDTDFYKNIWWPDIKRILLERNFPFSTYLIFNYNADTEPPFFTGEFFVAKNNASFEIAKEIIDSGWELGLHGYNHMSLSRQSSELNAHVWGSLENMETALKKAHEEWIRLFGKTYLPKTYVAPHNVISQEGIEILHKVFPSIKAVCTLYVGTGDEDHFDYGVHPELRDVYMLPRTGSGFHLDSTSKQYLISGITGPGIWSHFIHADDIFDPSRGRGKSWEQLRTEFTDMIDFVGKHYPWLEKLSVYDGYMKMRKHDETGVSVKNIGKTLTLETSYPGNLFRIRLNDKKVKNITGGAIIHKYNNPRSIIVKSDKPTVKINFQ